MVGNIIENVNCNPIKHAKESQPMCCEITRHMAMLPKQNSASNLLGAIKFIRYVPTTLPKSIIIMLNEK